MMKCVKRVIRRILCLATDKDYRLIYLSGLFDSQFYIEQNPEVVALGVDPLLHYMRSGIEPCKRKPGLLFDVEYYCLQYPEIELAGCNPFLHFLKTGWKEKKRPNFFFDIAFYFNRYQRDIGNNTNPLSFYAKKGWKRKQYPSSFFLSGTLHHRYEELWSQGIDPLSWLSRQRHHNRQNIAKYFDVLWYHDQLAVMPKDDLLLWHHYLDYGIHEGKNPLPLFDGAYYRDHNTDIEPYIEDLYAHYRDYERLDNRNPSPFFDASFYLRQFPGCRADGLTPLEHYLKTGVHKRAAVDPRVMELSSRPLISIVVPVYNAAPHHLNNCIRSVLYQTYPNWELCLCDDCSTAPHVRRQLLDWQAKDARIKVVFLDKNGGISEATNQAARLATGDFIGFLDNDDELTIDCLYWIARTINESNADFFYTDEILIGEDGRDFTPFYKPGFNRPLLLTHNYITHFVVVAGELFWRAGGCDSSMDGAQDFDLVLKISEIASRIQHIPRILYRWRASASSTSINHEQKSYADDSGKTALGRTLQRSGRQGWVEGTEWKFFYRLRYQPAAAPPSVTIIWVAAPGAPLDFTRMVAACDYPHHCLRIVMADHGNQENQMVADCPFDIIFRERHENPGALLNRAANKADSEFLVFLNDVWPQEPFWLQNLLEYAQDKNCGLTGARLIGTDGTELTGTAPDLHDESALYYALFLSSCSVHLNGLQWLQEVKMAPSFMGLIRRELFQEMAGFCEDFGTDLFLGLDLSLRLRRKGFRNLYNPHAVAEWDWKRKAEEEKGNERVRIARDADKKRFQKIWRDELRAGDPFYNPGCYRQRQISDLDFQAWLTGLRQNG